MSARIYEPYPLSKFKQLDKIKSLLKEDTEKSQLSPTDKDSSVTRAKIPKLETVPGEDTVQYLVSVLEEDLELSDKTILREHMRDFQTVSYASLSLEGLRRVLSVLRSKIKTLGELQLLFLTAVISNTIRRYKEDHTRILEELSQLTTDQSNLVVSILSSLISEEDLALSVLSWLEVHDIEATLETNLFTLWLRSVPVTSDTIPLVDRFLSTREEMLGDSNIMTLLAENCYKNSNSQQNKCLKFAKFYRKIFLTSLPANMVKMDHIDQFVKPLIENNETFLKKRMETELREIFPNVEEMDTKTTKEEEI